MSSTRHSDGGRRLAGLTVGTLLTEQWHTRPLASIGLVIGVVGCLLPPRGQNRFAPGAGIILNALMLYLTFALSYWLGG